MKKDIENKNKLKSKTKSKILVLGLILIAIIGIGLFSPMSKANAEDSGFCKNTTSGYTSDLVTESYCTTLKAKNPPATDWTFLRQGGPKPGDPGYMKCISLDAKNGYLPVGCTDTSGVTPPGAPKPSPTSANGSAFDATVALSENSCNVTPVGGGSFVGCILQFFYWTFYTLGAWLLAIAASFFNFFIKITLGSELLKSDFVSHAWGVVRDLSNIFFILILLYISIKIILDLGGHEAKKMIAKVIIIALLINFSMFFTQVIIDSSNILALIFYNKVNTVDKKNPNPNAAASLIDYATGEKDLAGGLTQSFNPVYKLDTKFFTDARIIKIPGQPTIEEPISTGTLIGITVIAGTIMLFAAYALFVSALSFLGRLIELFVLIIFSPFAFMSSTITILGHVDYIGWDAWFKRLLKTAFMAPIFMFFLYFIFLLLGEDMFKNILQGDGTVRTLLRIIIPAMVILILLLKATEFAKKGSGKFGEVLTKAAGTVGGVATGLALGAVTGGAAIAGRATLGRAGAAMANSEWAKQREREGKFGSRAFTKVAGGIGSGNFDVRGVKIGGKTLASATGMNVGEAKKGGFTERKKGAIENRAKRAKELQVGENDPLKQALNKTEMDLQALLGANTAEIEALDKNIEKKRQEVTDAKAQLDSGLITNTQYQGKVQDLTNAKDNKDRFRKGLQYTTSAGIVGRAGTSTVNIDSLEKQQKVDAQAIKTKNALSNQQYAAASQKGGVRALNFVLTGGAYTEAAAREAAHNIIMETKLDSGTKT